MSDSIVSSNNVNSFGCDTGSLLYKSLLPLFEYESKCSYVFSGLGNPHCYGEMLNWISTFGTMPRDCIDACDNASAGSNGCEDPLCTLHVCVDAMASYVEQEFDKNHRQLYVEYECGEYGATHRHLIDRHENLPGEHLEKLSYAIKWLRRWRQDVVAECEKKKRRIQNSDSIYDSCDA